MHGSQSVCCLEEEAGTFVVAEIDTQCGYKICLTSLMHAKPKEKMEFPT